MGEVERNKVGGRCAAGTQAADGAGGGDGRCLGRPGGVRGVPLTFSGAKVTLLMRKPAGHHVCGRQG